MTSGQKEQAKSNLPALVCQLQELADKIRQQVEQELAGMQETRQSGAQESQAVCETLPKHQEIYRLAEKGLEPLEISQRTGRTLGEVQVILALRKSE